MCRNIYIYVCIYVYMYIHCTSCSHMYTCACVCVCVRKRFCTVQSTLEARASVGSHLASKRLSWAAGCGLNWKVLATTDSFSLVRSFPTCS